MKFRSKLAVLLGAGVSCAALLTAGAQNPPGGSSSGVETITVTATKVKTNVQKVPISVNAVSGARLDRTNTTTLESLERMAPEVQLAPNLTGAILAIRGSYNRNDAAGTDHSVGFLIDEVPAAGAADASLDQGIYDVDRIEILRGPQGTLFGRNALGGIISVHSKEPSFDTSGRLEVGYGNYGAYQVQGYVTGALSDDLAGRFAFLASGNNGYRRNVLLGGWQGEVDNFSGRGQLLWTPNEDVTVRAIVEGVHSKGESFSATLGNFQPNVVQPLLRPTRAGPWGPAGVYPTLIYTPDEVLTPDNGLNEKNNLSGTLSVDWAIGTLGTLTSITGYRTADVGYRNVGDVTPFGNSIVISSNVEKQFSEELRLTSPQDQPFRYVVGGIYLTNSRDLELDVPLDYSMFPALSTSLTPTLGRLNETGSSLMGLGVKTTWTAQDVQQNQNVDLTSYAIFGEFNYDLTDELTVTIGGRYTVDEREGSTFKSYNYAGVVQGSTIAPGTQIGLTPANIARLTQPAPACTTNPDGLGCFPAGTAPLVPIIATNAVPLGTRTAFPAFAGGPGISAVYGETWEAFTPKVSLSYQATEDLLFYGTIARGFTAGGFTQRATNGLGLAVPFNPEFAWNYELGMKATFFEGRLLTNIALYRMEYTDLQVVLFEATCACSIVKNAAKAHSQGFELSVIGQPVEWLTLGVNWAYNDAKYDNYIAPSSLGGPPVDNSGKRMINTPKNAVNIFADVVFDLPDGGELRFGANLAYAGERYFNDSNNDPAFIKSRSSKDGILDLTLGWTSEDGRWGAMAWGKNVTDERYLVTAVAGLSSLFAASVPALPAGSEIAGVRWNLPATYGVTLSYRFGE